MAKDPTQKTKLTLKALDYSCGPLTDFCISTSISASASAWRIS